MAKPEIFDKARRAYEMRITGKSYADIAHELEVSEKEAHQFVTRTVKKIHLDTPQEILDLDLARIELMIQELWPQRGTARVAAVILLMVEMRARILGTFAPTKIAPTTPDGKAEYTGVQLTDEERAKRVQAIMAKARGDGFADDIIKSLGAGDD